MTGPEVRIHALTGEVEVLTSPSPGAAVATPPPEKQTRPIQRISRPVAAWPAVFLAVRAQWRGGSPGLRATLLVLVAVAGVLVLRLAEHDTEPGHAVVSPPAAKQSTAAPSSAAAEPSVTPVEVPATEDPTAIYPVQLSAEQVTALPQTGVTDPLPGAPADPAPTAGPGGEVLHPVDTTVAYSEPGGPAFGRLPVTLLGADTWVPVIDRRPGWAMVLLPGAVPDGQPSPAGWIHLTSTVLLGHVDLHLRIDSHSGTVSLVGTLDEADPGGAGAAPDAEEGRRTFVALSPAGRPKIWPASVWWPLVVRVDRLCPAVWGGLVIPGLRWGTLINRLDPTGCLPIPTPTRSILRDLPAGTVVFVR